jgi:hypothetical protein
VLTLHLYSLSNLFYSLLYFAKQTVKTNDKQLKIYLEKHINSFHHFIRTYISQGYMIRYTAFRIQKVKFQDKVKGNANLWKITLTRIKYMRKATNHPNVLSKTLNN